MRIQLSIDLQKFRYIYFSMYLALLINFGINHFYLALPKSRTGEHDYSSRFEEIEENSDGKLQSLSFVLAYYIQSLPKVLGTLIQ